MASRGFYFGAGPATLPEPILKAAQAELLNWRDTGLSILELGHRTKAFEALLDTATQDLRELLAIPDNYQVLFLGGAARLQFAMAPMNLVTQDKPRTAYLTTGLWSKLAYDEALRLSDAYLYEPHQTALDDQTAYLYYTPNETVDGVYTKIPDKAFVGEIPLVADMTSCLLSEVIDVSRFGMIFAGAQKNIGPAGLTIVIIREDLLKNTPKATLPVMLDYRIHAQNQSLYATPPVFQCDMAARMFQWIKAQGGVAALQQMNRAKAQKLYDYIDGHPAYLPMVHEVDTRSIMNVCFSLADEQRTADFLIAADKANLKGLKGHRQKGGLRASLYNAMPLAGVDALIELMDAFAA